MHEQHHFTRRGFLGLAGLGTAATFALGARAFAATAGVDSDPRALAEEAYIWGFPLVMNQIYLKNSLDKGVPLNHLFVSRGLSTPAFNVGGPNVDTLYGAAWLDVSKEPQVVIVPDTSDRYYSIQLQDVYGNSFAYIGRRTTGTRAGAYAVTPPGWRGALPAGVQRISAPTAHVLALARTLVSSDEDLPVALAVQAKYALSPLSGYPTAATPGTPAELPLNFPVIDLSIHGIAFFDELGEALAVDPPPASDQALLQRFAAIGVGPRLRPSQGKDPTLLATLNTAVPAANQRIRTADYTTHANGWSVGYGITPFIGDPLLRACSYQFGPGAHVAAEALYFSALAGPDGKLLSGANSYLLRFAAGALPPVDAFWSLTLYGLDFRLIENPIKRYAIGDRTAGLARNVDGSLDIYIQHKVPQQGNSNWLPAPAGGFKLILRAYQPKKTVLDGSYHLPPLTIATL